MAPPTKRARTSSNSSPQPPSKTSKTSKSTSSIQKQTDSEGNPFWPLKGDTRRLTLSSFKGKSLVNIREYYEKDGKKLPGKKGISITVDQFCALVKAIPGVIEGLQEMGERGVDLPRVSVYDNEDEDEEDEGEQGVVKKKKRNGVKVEAGAGDGDGAKRNFEETSEEES